MIVQITENRLVDGQWFLAPQQYALVQRYFAPVTLCDSCVKTYPSRSIEFFDIIVNDVVYTIPYDMAVVLDKEHPSKNKKGFVERWEAQRCKDITLKPGEYTDVVKQAERYLGVDIRKHLNDEQVDGIRLRKLREMEHYRHVPHGLYEEGCPPKEGFYDLHPDIPVPVPTGYTVTFIWNGQGQIFFNNETKPAISGEPTLFYNVLPGIDLGWDAIPNGIDPVIHGTVTVGDHDETFNIP